MPNDSESGIRQISVEEFLNAVSARYPVRSRSAVELLQRHFLSSSRVQKLGLALSGFADKIHKGRIQIYGNSESSYIARLSAEEVAAAYERLDKGNISCILVTAGIEPPDELVKYGTENSIPILVTRMPSSDAIAAVSSASASLASGSRPGRREASNVLPQPGGPISSKW